MTKKFAAAAFPPSFARLRLCGATICGLAAASGYTAACARRNRPWTQKPIRLSNTAENLGTGLCGAGRPRRALEKPVAAARCRWKPTPRLPSTTSSLDRATAGGADRDRTDDLRLAKPALSQLSYSPNETPDHPVELQSVVGLGRFELPTSRLSGGRSNQLSYRPNSREPRAPGR